MTDDATVHIEVSAEGIAVGWIEARGCRVGTSSDDLRDEIIRDSAAAAESAEAPERLDRKKAVRDMLRHGAYKPTGRGKPASEYLLRAAAEGDFPAVNNLVDINNLVSVSTQLPISIVDLERTGSETFRIRWGREDEEYVFNPSGQVLGLRDLLLAAHLPSDSPCATPIKDCQATKTHDETKDVAGFIYAPIGLTHEAEAAAARMAELIRHHAGAEVRHGVVQNG